MQTKATLSVSQKPNIHHWLVVFFMAACFAFASWLTPHVTWFEHIGSPQFEQITPKQFGDWVEITEAAGSNIVDPEQQYAINNLYTQTVSRIYEQRTSGRRIMLSLAYGDNQTFSKQLHRPEACYSSQGFKIENLREDKLQAIDRSIAVSRMRATIGSRLEYVTYWIRIGDSIISGPPTALNIARLQMGLKGYITDGLLFRVSEVGDDETLSNALQDQFIRDFLQALSPAQQAILIGQNVSKN
jgi:EpsI family protein